VKDKDLRDLNEYATIVKRGGRVVNKNNLFLNLKFEDDTDFITCTVSRWDYPKFGKVIVDNAAIGDWFLIKGEIRRDWRKIYISKIRKLT